MANDILDIINEEMLDFANRLVDDLEAAAALLPENTGKGRASIRQEVIQANRGKIAKAMFQFEGYLRYFDMRKPTYREPIPGESLLDWVTSDENQGGRVFEAGYIRKYGALPKDYTQFLNKLTYGINVNLVKRGKRKAKRTKWYSTTVNRNVYDELYGNLIDRLQVFSLQDIKKALRA